MVGGALVTILVAAASHPVRSGAFIFAGTANGVGVITHPIGYTGTGGTLSLTVGIDPTSANASSMAISVQNVVNTINALSPVTGNLVSGTSNNIPSGQVDFESVALHEVLHSLGLAHPNLASESGLSDPEANYTQATPGTNGTYDLGSGSDLVIGSSDDARGDDVNLHWFRIANNNPFTIAGTVDSTTYSRNVASLPAGHSFVANADRAVSTLLGAGDTEAVMQQGIPSDEARRTLNHDDAATLRLAMAGLDETAGTADDYTVTLSYAGLTTSADIVLDFDNAKTAFGVSETSGTFINGTHVRITATAVYFNTDFSWFFNDETNACSYAIAPTSAASPPAGLTGSVTVTAGATCAWTAASNSAFLSVTSGASGTGNGTVGYAVAANSTPSARDGTITIAGATFSVSQSGGFTDDPVSAGTTVVSAAHILELRGRANGVRSACGLSAFSFTDSSLTAGTSLVKLIHLTELRTAVSEAYAACGRPLPSFTDPSPTDEVTQIKAAHINELRSAIIALE